MPNGYGGPLPKSTEEGYVYGLEQDVEELEDLLEGAEKEIIRLKRELTIAISKQDKS